jgi:hypothetical protein
MTFYIHLVGAESGGVGKTTFCKLLLEFLIANEINHYLVDADPGQPNVGFAYAKDRYPELVPQRPLEKIDRRVNYEKIKEQEKFQPIYFSDGDDFAVPDRLLDLAQEHEHVVVNLPANVQALVDKWLVKSDIVGDFIKNEMDIQLVYWYVGVPTDISIDTFKALRSNHEDRIRYVFVFNMHKKFGKWENKYSPELGAYFEKNNVVKCDLIDLEAGEEEKSLLFDRHYPFYEIIEDSERTLCKSLPGRLRVERFRDLAIKDIQVAFTKATGQENVFNI